MQAPDIWENLGAAAVFAAMAEEVEQCNLKNGWYANVRSFGEEIALLHSEISEALEAYREFGGCGRYYDYWDKENPEESYRCGLDEKYNEGSEYRPGCKPLGVPSELADVLVRLLDTCKRYNIDLYGEYRAKMDYNWQRSYRHGGKAL